MKTATPKLPYLLRTSAKVRFAQIPALIIALAAAFMPFQATRGQHRTSPPPPKTKVPPALATSSGFPKIIKELEFGYSLRETRDGGMVLAGVRQEGGVIARFDASGKEIWRQLHGRPGFLGTDWPAYDVLELADGSFAATGIGAGPVHISQSAMFVLRLAADGKKLWENQQAQKDRAAFGNGLQLLANGTLLVNGVYLNQGPLLAEFDLQGNEVREKTFPKSEHAGMPPLDNYRQIFTAAWQSGDGSVYLAWTEDFSTADRGETKEGRILKLSPEWSTLWSDHLGSEVAKYVFITGLAPHPEGGVVVLGQAHADSPLWSIDSEHGFAARYTPEGKRAWLHWFGHPRTASGGYPETYPRAVSARADGGFLITGYVRSVREGTNYLTWVAGLSADGRIEWERFFASPPASLGYAITPLARGGYALLGTTRHGNVDCAYLLRLPAGFVPPDELKLPEVTLLQK